jgi:putative endonuclease
MPNSSPELFLCLNMPKANIELGRTGEQAAVQFLKSNGYNIISTNYHTRLGQIDIIAKDKDAICFVEVKTRRTHAFGRPDEAVWASKQRKISQVALMFLKQRSLLNSPARFDVVSISYIDSQPGQPKIELKKNAFELDYHYLY